MAKIELNTIKENQAVTAACISGKILRGTDDFENFRIFVASGYGIQNRQNKKNLNFHEINRERDTAIVSLILGSGLRLSEIASTDLADLDTQKGCIRVYARETRNSMFTAVRLHYWIYFNILQSGKRDIK